MNLPDNLKPPEGGYKTLKTTPEFPGWYFQPTKEEMEEFRIIWEYEQAIQDASTRIH